MSTRSRSAWTSCPRIPSDCACTCTRSLLVAARYARKNTKRSSPRQAVGAYDSFDHTDGRLAMLMGYRADLDVFVLWDASLHPRFKNGGNIQVRDSTVNTAAASGRATQRRPLSSGNVELVIACQSWNLAQALNDRLAWTGGEEENLWAASQT
jgi:hypothetical protein